MSTDKQWKDWGDRNIDTLDMARMYYKGDYNKKPKQTYIQLLPLVVVILLIVIILYELL